MELSEIGQGIFNEFIQNAPYKIEFPLRETIRKYSGWKDSYTALINIFTEYLTHEDLAEITRQETNETYFKLTDKGRRLKRYKTLKELKRQEDLEDKAITARYRRDIWWFGSAILTVALGLLVWFVQQVAKSLVQEKSKIEKTKSIVTKDTLMVKVIILKDSSQHH